MRMKLETQPLSQCKFFTKPPAAAPLSRFSQVKSKLAFESEILEMQDKFTSLTEGFPSYLQSKVALIVFVLLHPDSSSGRNAITTLNFISLGYFVEHYWSRESPRLILGMWH